MSQDWPPKRNDPWPEPIDLLQQKHDGPTHHGKFLGAFSIPESSEDGEEHFKAVIRRMDIFNAEGNCIGYVEGFPWTDIPKGWRATAFARGRMEKLGESYETRTEAEGRVLQYHIATRPEPAPKSVALHYPDWRTVGVEDGDEEPS